MQQDPTIAQPVPQGHHAVQRTRRETEAEDLDPPVPDYMIPFPDFKYVITFNCMLQDFCSVKISEDFAINHGQLPSDYPDAVKMTVLESLTSRTDPDHTVEITTFGPFIDSVRSLQNASAQGMRAVHTSLQAVDEDVKARSLLRRLISQFGDVSISCMLPKTRMNYSVSPMYYDPEFTEYVRLFGFYLAERFSVGQFKNVFDRIEKAISKTQRRINTLLNLIESHGLNINMRFNETIGPVHYRPVRLRNNQFTQEVINVQQSYYYGMITKSRFNKEILRLIHNEIGVLNLTRINCHASVLQRINEVEVMMNQFSEDTLSYFGLMKGNLLNLIRILTSSVHSDDLHDFREGNRTYRIYPEHTMNAFTSMNESIKREYERLRSLLVQRRQEIKEHLGNVDYRVSLDIRAYHENCFRFAARSVDYMNDVGIPRSNNELVFIYKHTHEHARMLHY